MRSLFVLVTAAVLLAGCEKVIKLELNNVESTLVVEGNISDQPGPYYVSLPNRYASMLPVNTPVLPMQR